MTELVSNNPSPKDLMKTFISGKLQKELEAAPGFSKERRLEENAVVIALIEDIPEPIAALYTPIKGITSTPEKNQHLWELAVVYFVEDLKSGNIQIFVTETGYLLVAGKNVPKGATAILPDLVVFNVLTNPNAQIHQLHDGRTAVAITKK